MIARHGPLGHANELTSQRWRDNAHEPSWFYDLHPSFRELMAAGGDLVLLGAAHPKRQARACRDVPEIEFLDAGRRIAEIDLIALVDQELVQVEVKAAGILGTGSQREREVTKKLKIAEIMRVDAIVLATPQTAWSAADVSALREGSEQLARAKPEIRTLTGLGPGTGHLA
jgi:hypothetical protein